MNFIHIKMHGTTIKMVAVNFTANIVYHPRIPKDLEIGKTKFSETWSQWVEQDDAQDWMWRPICYGGLSEATGGRHRLNRATI